MLTKYFSDAKIKIVLDMFKIANFTELSQKYLILLLLYSNKTLQINILLMSQICLYVLVHLIYDVDHHIIYSPLTTYNFIVSPNQTNSLQLYNSLSIKLSYFQMKFLLIRSNFNQINKIDSYLLPTQSSIQNLSNFKFIQLHLLLFNLSNQDRQYLAQKQQQLSGKTHYLYHLKLSIYIQISNTVFFEMLFSNQSSNDVYYYCKILNIDKQMIQRQTNNKHQKYKQNLFQLKRLLYTLALSSLVNSKNKFIFCKTACTDLPITHLFKYLIWYEQYILTIVKNIFMNHLKMQQTASVYQKTAQKMFSVLDKRDSFKYLLFEQYKYLKAHIFYSLYFNVNKSSQYHYACD
ncbi:hypothetical protein ABPG74_002062 [Tetrahymena malaccensis]